MLLIPKCKVKDKQKYQLFLIILVCYMGFTFYEFVTLNRVKNMECKLRRKEFDLKRDPARPYLPRKASPVPYSLNPKRQVFLKKAFAIDKWPEELVFGCGIGL